MDKFVTSTKKKYRDRLINCEKQWPPCKTQKLIRLELVEQEQGQIYQRGKDEVVKRTPIAYSDLFLVEAGRKPIRKILAEGDAGIGKTTFSVAASEDWANGKMFQQFELLLLLPLRQKEVALAGSISELLKLFHRSTDICSSVASYLEEEEGEKVLIIADGWDELDASQRKEGSFIYELLFGDLLPFVSVVLTSRQAASTPLHDLPCIDRLVEVCGFNNESIKDYIQSEFPRDHEKAHRLQDQLEKNPLIKSICNIPLNCAIICHLWRTLAEALPTSLTELYTEIILNVVLRNIRKYPAYENIRSLSRFDAFPKGLQESWWLLCRFAYHSLSKEKLVFSEDELLALLPQGSTLDENILCFGLLQSYESIIEVGHVPSFHFLHLTFQEYLVALYFVHHPPHLQLMLLRRHAKNESFNTVLIFFFGIGFRGIHSSKDHMIDFKRAIGVFAQNQELTLCHCAVEAKQVDADVAQKIQACSISATLRFGSAGSWCPHSPYDCAGIIQFLAELKNVDTKLEIFFSYCGVGDEMITALAEVLAGKLGKLQVTGLYLGNNKLTDKSVEVMFYRASSSLQQLDSLYLHDNHITATGLSAIALHSTNIAWLNLSGNPLGVSGMQILKESVLAGKLAKLKMLDLSHCLTDDADDNGELLATFMEAVAAHCLHLAIIDLSKNNLGIPGAQALGRAMSKLGSSMRSSQSLSLNEAKLGNEGVSAFVKSIVGNTYVSSLELKRNNIDSEGVSFLSEGFTSRKFASFYELTLDDNPLGLSGILEVGHMLSKSTCNLKNLSLSKCQLFSETVTAKSTEKQLCSMSPASLDERLRLDYNNFSGAGIHILRGIMHVCRNASSIMVTHCGIDSDDIVHLLDGIAESKSFGDCRLSYWDLTNNAICDSGVAALIKHLPSLFPELASAAFLQLDGNNISKAMEDTLSEELRKTSKYKYYTSEAKLTPDGCYHFGDNVEVKGDVFKYTGGQDSDAGLIKVLKQMSSSHNYFECEITSGGKQPATGVGIGSFTYPLNRMPGWESNGLGYHSDDGKLYRSNKLRFSLSSYGPVYVGDNVDFSFDLKQGSSIRFFLTINGKRNEMRFLGSSYGLKYGPICAVGDRMGCGVEFEGAARDSVNVFFTVNGKVVGNLIHFKIPDDGLYPLIGMCNEGDQVKYLGQWQHHPHIEVNETKTKVITRRCDTRYIRSEPSSKAEIVGFILPGECFTKVDEVENEAGKWLLVEREALQPFGWIDAQDCIAEDNQENPQEKESISQDVSLSCVKKPTDVENSTVLGEQRTITVSCEELSYLLGPLIVKMFPAQLDTNTEVILLPPHQDTNAKHDNSSGEEYEMPPNTPSLLPVMPPTDGTQQKDVSDHILTPSDLSKILSALWEGRSRWYNLGLELKLSPGTLEAIKLENPYALGDCFRAILYEWLKKDDPPRTWRTLSKALRSPTVKMGELVKEWPHGL